MKNFVFLGLANSGVTEGDLPRIYRYEREASRLGLALLEQSGEFRLARWLTNRFGADWKFLRAFLSHWRESPLRSRDRR